MRGLVNFCDFFVIATGTSDRHVKSIAEGIQEGLGKLGIKAHMGRTSKDSASDSEGAWLLLDLGDVVIHMFEPRSREFYSLEHLWQDAPKTKYK